MSTRGKKNERGASAVEYGLIAALLGIVFVAVMVAMVPKMIDNFERGGCDESRGYTCVDL